MIHYDWQKIHYISPKPEDVKGLMQGLLETLDRTLTSDIDPVILAASIAFGFVFIHPFEDGNGRAHRFLIHYVLSRKQYTPPSIIFPISAIMLENIKAYDTVLESFSKPLMELITQYELSNEGALTVNQATELRYKYIDYTQMAEYLFVCIEKTLHEYLEKELDFLVRYDRTKREIQNFIDMPDKLIDLFIRLAIQNKGELGQHKRDRYFYQLSDSEVDTLQTIIKVYMLGD